MSALNHQNLAGETVVVGSETRTVGPKIGSGAEGTVYRLEGPKESVVKVFNPDCRAEKADKVRAMVQPENRPRDRTYEQEGVRSIIWPQEVVEDNSGRFLGYKMPEKDLDEALDALSYAMFELTWDDSTQEDRLMVAYNLAFQVYEIHEQEHAIGDYNHENIFINEGFVTLIDCDAFHINTETTTYDDDTYFPRYSPPEKRPDSLEEVKDADRFCLGVHIFQLLMEGSHPFLAQGSDAATGSLQDMIQGNAFPYETSADGLEPHDGMQTKYDQLPREIRKHFTKCFDTGAKDLGWGRPSPKEWARVLGKAAGIPKEQLPGGDESNSSGATGPGEGDEWQDFDPFEDDNTPEIDDGEDTDQATDNGDDIESNKDSWIETNPFEEDSTSTSADDGGNTSTTTDDEDQDEMDDDWMDTDPFED
ncbi:hypothetical protein [Halosimplex pelagicum]|uniref:Protein kinase domain-containing protein n=1 Tax=Halosimplex pelagicum TaxID=869886 RepID=A0A7D5PBJ0_9EURY|nr:hypothetical protein [Halosimplex pelagicum]QLH83764.1 hypothetical protein HZS54_19965 [Halosimplex pelagicum]